MRITLKVSQNLEKNAEVYFEKAKKSRRKIGGAKEIVEKTEKKLEKLKREEAVQREKDVEKKERKKEWYEKFRWFITSDGFLVIGGRDATSNEIVIKKHTEQGDVVLHTDMAGSPFFVIKSEGRKVSEQAMQEAADATCSFSRAWKLGLSSQSVFYVNPDQVTKEAQAGEYLAKGAFMIRGKTTYVDNKINCALGMTEKGMIMAGPVEAVKAHCKQAVALQQGNEKASKIAKHIKHKIGGELDDIIRAMPSGGVKLKK